MERAGRFLGSALRRLKRPEAGIAWLTSTWPEIVGKTLAAHIHPVSCEGGHLEVTADTKQWANQIQSMQQEFCAQINCAWGGDLVSEVTVLNEPKAGPAAQHVSREMDNHHTPFIRRRHI